MKFAETSNVRNLNRRCRFHPIKWLNKSQFLEKIGKGDSILPNIDNNTVFVGRSSHPQILGNVVKNVSTGEWQLNVPQGCDVRVFKDDFSVLSLEDPDCFMWVKTTKANIPSYALRGSFNEEYHYIGKTIPFNDIELTDENTSCVYYHDRNGYWQAEQFNETVPQLFGKIHPSHNCLYVPYKNFELDIKKYEILCLKPTPTSLKELCRLRVRVMSRHSNEIIERMNKDTSDLIYIPNVLIDYLKYPTYLTVGECLLKNEKIVSNDGQFEMTIENDSLVIRSVILNEKSLTRDELIKLKDVQIINLISTNVRSMILEHGKILLERFTSNRFRIYDETSENYRIHISETHENNGGVQPASLKIEYLD